MLTVPWSAAKGWSTPRIVPCKSLYHTVASRMLIPKFSDGPLALEPSSTVFHYAQCIFEGMKAYRQPNGKVTLFRPDMNMKRMNNSAHRIALPVCTFGNCSVSSTHLFIEFQTGFAFGTDQGIDPTR
jgi:branched-chain amino acid aminotransferase